MICLYIFFFIVFSNINNIRRIKSVYKNIFVCCILICCCSRIVKLRNCLVIVYLNCCVQIICNSVVIQCLKCCISRCRSCSFISSIICCCCRNIISNSVCIIILASCNSNCNIFIKSKVFKCSILCICRTKLIICITC